jgi:hypothetical protein
MWRIELLVVWCLCLFVLVIASSLQPSPIHDNSIPELSSSWVPLEPAEALNYFSASEVCRAFKHRISFCEKLPRKRPEDSMPEFCGGAKRGKTDNMQNSCPNRDSMFFRHASTHTDSHLAVIDLITVMLTKMRRNRLVLIGDSMSRQQMEVALCDLWRHGYRMNSKNRLEFSMDLEVGMMLGDHHINESVIMQFRDKKFHFELIWLVPSLWPAQNWNYVKEQMQKIPPRSAIVVVNMGLHMYHPKPEDLQLYESQFELLFNHTVATLLHSDNQQYVFYRETAAQHFPTFDGSAYESEAPVHFFAIGKVLRGSKSLGISSLNMSLLIKSDHHYLYRCQPLTNSNALVHQYWRNALAIKALRRMQLLSSMSFSMFSELSSSSQSISEGLLLHQYPISFIPAVQRHYKQQQSTNKVASYVALDPKTPLRSLLGNNDNPRVMTKRRLRNAARKSAKENQVQTLKSPPTDTDASLTGYANGVTLLSFYLETAGRFDLHAQNTDCSHFCPSPLLWQPLWEQLLLHAHAIVYERTLLKKVK